MIRSRLQKVPVYHLVHTHVQRIGEDPFSFRYTAKNAALHIYMCANIHAAPSGIKSTYICDTSLRYRVFQPVHLLSRRLEIRS